MIDFLINMSKYFTVRPEHFQPCIVLNQYRVYRDGFCLMIIDDRNRRGYVLSRQQDLSLLQSRGLPLAESLLEALYTGDQSLSMWNIPTDEVIIQYAIDQAIIPHPYEVYG